MLQTALDGHGIALGILPFVEEYLHTGKLIRPFDVAIDPGQAYYLIQRKNRPEQAAVKSVRNWLLAQIQSP